MKSRGKSGQERGPTLNMHLKFEPYLNFDFRLNYTVPTVSSRRYKNLTRVLYTQSNMLLGEKCFETINPEKFN